MVVSATRGEAGQIRSAGVATRRTLGQVRAQELSLACQRLGVQYAVCLDFGDGRLQEVDQDVLIVEIIRRFRPEVVKRRLIRSRRQGSQEESKPSQLQKNSS